MIRYIRTLVPIAALSLVFVQCGGDDSGSNTGAGAPGTPGGSAGTPGTGAGTGGKIGGGGTAGTGTPAAGSPSSGSGGSPGPGAAGSAGTAGGGAGGGSAGLPGSSGSAGGPSAGSGGQGSPGGSGGSGGATAGTGGTTAGSGGSTAGSAGRGGASAGTGGSGGGSPGAGTFMEVRTILQDTCVRCHGGMQNMHVKLHNDEGLYDRLTSPVSPPAEAACVGQRLVVPNMPEMSLLYQIVQPNASACGGQVMRMPQGCSNNGPMRCLTSAQIETIRSWIAAGAPE